MTSGRMGRGRNVAKWIRSIWSRKARKPVWPWIGARVAGGVWQGVDNRVLVSIIRRARSSSAQL